MSWIRTHMRQRALYTQIGEFLAYKARTSPFTAFEYQDWLFRFAQHSQLEDKYLETDQIYKFIASQNGLYLKIRSRLILRAFMKFADANRVEYTKPMKKNKQFSEMGKASHISRLRDWGHKGLSVRMAELANKRWSKKLSTPQ